MPIKNVAEFVFVFLLSVLLHRHRSGQILTFCRDILIEALRIAGSNTNVSSTWAEAANRPSFIPVLRQK
jgi:hypothetical protein